MGKKPIRIVIACLLGLLVLAGLAVAYQNWNITRMESRNDSGNREVAELRQAPQLSEKWRDVPVNPEFTHFPTTIGTAFLDCTPVGGFPALAYLGGSGGLAFLGKALRQKLDKDTTQYYFKSPIWFISEFPGEDADEGDYGVVVSVASVDGRFTTCLSGSPGECFAPARPDFSGDPAWLRIPLPGGDSTTHHVVAVAAAGGFPLVAAITNEGELQVYTMVAMGEWQTEVLATDIEEFMTVDAAAGPGYIAIGWDGGWRINCAVAALGAGGRGEWQVSDIAAGYGLSVADIGGEPYLAFHELEGDGRIALASPAAGSPGEEYTWRVSTISPGCENLEIPSLVEVDGKPVVSFVERPNPDYEAENSYQMIIPELTGTLRLASARVSNPQGPADWAIEDVTGVYGETCPRLMYTDGVLFVVYCREMHRIAMKRRDVAVGKSLSDLQ